MICYTDEEERAHAEHKFNCLARHIAKLNNKDRNEFIIGIKKKHGADFTERLLIKAREEYRKLNPLPS